VLAGNTRLAVAIRGQVRRSAAGPGQESLADVIRERAAVLRVAGLISGALLLVAWPDPSARVYVSVLALLALYLGVVWAISSDSDRAQDVRKRAGDAWQRYFVSRPVAAEGAGRFSIWIIARAMWLRVVGIVVAVVLLLIWPSLTVGSIVAVVALLLAYLAGIDFIVSRQHETDA
jgi:hypothetical protein